MESILNALMAQAAESTSPAGPAGPSGPTTPADGCQAMFGQFGFLIIIVVIFYFLLIRPQQKQAKQHRELLSALKKGDNVVTASGILGSIVNINETVVTLEIAKSVHIRVLRSQVAGKQPGEKGFEDAPAAPTGK